jgi:hypothetical protein
LVKKRRKNEEKNEEDPHSGWDGRLRDNQNFSPKKEVKMKKNRRRSPFLIVWKVQTRTDTFSPPPPP